MSIQFKILTRYGHFVKNTKGNLYFTKKLNEKIIATSSNICEAIRKNLKYLSLENILKFRKKKKEILNFRNICEAIFS